MSNVVDHAQPTKRGLWRYFARRSSPQHVSGCIFPLVVGLHDPVLQQFFFYPRKQRVYAHRQLYSAGFERSGFGSMLQQEFSHHLVLTDLAPLDGDLHGTHDTRNMYEGGMFVGWRCHSSTQNMIKVTCVSCVNCTVVQKSCIVLVVQTHTPSGRGEYHTPSV